MVRKQVYIDEDLDHGLKILAARTGEPEAVHVRAALRSYLASRRPVETTHDPLLEMVGMVQDGDGPDDVALEHDHYLYGAPKGR